MQTTTTRKTKRGFLRRLFTVLVIYSVISVVVLGVLFFAPELWSPPLARQIEKQAWEKAKLQLTIDRARLIGLWPLTLRLEKMQVMPDAGPWLANVAAMDIRVGIESIDGNWARPKLALGLALLHPQVQVKIEPVPKDAPAATLQSAGPVQVPMLRFRPFGVDLALAIDVQQGELVLKGASFPVMVRELQVDLQVPSLRESWWRPKLTVGASVETQVAGAPLKLPLKLDVQEAALNPQGLNLDKMILSIANLQLGGKGQKLFSEMRDDFHFTVLPVDLKELPPAFLPAGQWQGTFSGGFTYQKEGESPGKVQGRFESQGVQGLLDWKKNDWKARGQVSVKTSVRFLFQDQLTLDDTSLAVDLTNAEFDLPGLFTKSKDVPMSLDVVADASEKLLKLRRAFFRLAHLRLEAAGQVATEGYQSQLEVVLPQTALSGLEKHFPLLNKAPIKGVVNARLGVRGPLNKSEELQVLVHEASLKQAAGQLQYDFAADKKVRGPFGADLTAKGVLVGQRIKSLETSGRADFSELQIDWADVVKKPAGWKLALAWNVARAQETWSLRVVRLNTLVGELEVAGQIKPGERIETNFKAQIENLNLGTLSQVVKIPAVKLGGFVSGELDLAGRFHSDEGIAYSPLVVNGQIGWKQGAVTFKRTSAATQAPPAALPAVKQPEAWLPSWPVFRQSKVALNVELKEADVMNVQLKGVRLNGQWANGRFQGQMKIDNLWNGEVMMPKFVVGPMNVPPNMEFKGSFQRLEVGSLLAWYNPQMKNYMSGQVGGNIEAGGLVPDEAHGLQNMKGQGDLQISQGVLNTYQIEEKINSNLVRLKLKEPGPGSGSKVPFYAQTSVQLVDGNVQLDNLLLNTERQDELKLRGVLRRDLQVELSGTVAIGSTRFSGAIASANSDKNGRLVIPLTVSGDIRKPDFALSESTVKAMLSKTVEAEAKNLGEKLKQSAGDELKKKLKNILGK